MTKFILTQNKNLYSEETCNFMFIIKSNDWIFFLTRTLLFSIIILTIMSKLYVTQNKEVY